jgi:hypothetical protein
MVRTGKLFRREQTKKPAVCDFFLISTEDFAHDRLERVTIEFDQVRLSKESLILRELHRSAKTIDHEQMFLL